MPIHGNFEALGIAPQYMEQQFPALAGTYSGRLIIVGSGACVWGDLERAGMAKNHDTGVHAADIMAVNDMMAYYPGVIEHGYSNDHNMIPRWVASRRPQYVARWEVPRHLHTCHHGAANAWPWPGHGTSGLGAVYTGLALGYEEVWLCGVPLDNSGFFFAPNWEVSNYGNSKDRDDPNRIPYWTNAAQRMFEGRVKSFSGRTRELLGEPQA